MRDLKYWSLLYSAILRSRADSLRSHVILHERIAIYSAFFIFYFLFNIHRSDVLTALAWLVPKETAAISARSVYTIQPCTMSLHAKPHACLAETCHLHFWHNDLGLLRATAVTRGWNGYRNTVVPFLAHSTTDQSQKIYFRNPGSLGLRGTQRKAKHLTSISQKG